MRFGFGKGKRKGRSGKRYLGGKGFWRLGRPFNCVCPHCGTRLPQKSGLPCFQTKCPHCGSPMTRPFSYEK